MGIRRISCTYAYIHTCWCQDYSGEKLEILELQVIFNGKIDQSAKSLQVIFNGKILELQVIFNNFSGKIDQSAARS